MIFGHQTDDTQTTNSSLDALAQESTEGNNTDSGASQPGSISTGDHSDPAPSSSQSSDLPSAPSHNDSSASEVHPDSPASRESKDKPATSDDQHGLLALKQQALQQLTPLVHQLDQNPEERFRTTMMMIQSTDNQSLIKDAYEAAQAISDDKVRAQALLDVINEINYFTQQKN